MVFSTIKRVTKPGGLIIVATAAPGDISQVETEPLGNGVYRSRVPGQEGCVLLIPDMQALSELFSTACRAVLGLDTAQAKLSTAGAWSRDYFAVDHASC